MYAYPCVSGVYEHIIADSHRDQKRVLDPIELELQVLVSQQGLL